MHNWNCMTFLKPMNTSLLLQQTRLNCAGLIATRKQKKWVFPSPWIFIHVGWKKLARLFFFSLGPFSKLQYENSMCCMDYQQLKEYIFHKILEHCRLQTFGTGAAGSRGISQAREGPKAARRRTGRERMEFLVCGPELLLLLSHFSCVWLCATP